jgi:hypothetical protein
MIFISDECLKESPCSPGYAAYVTLFSGRKLSNLFDVPATYEECDERRNNPRHQEWRSKRQRMQT